MSVPKYIKCPCQHCGGTIEFPAQGLGLAVPCPHCQHKTTLFAPPRAAADAPAPSPPKTAAVDPPKDGQPESGVATAPSPRRFGRVGWIVLLAVVAAAAAAGLLMRQPGLNRTPPAEAERRVMSTSSVPSTATPLPETTPPVDVRDAPPKSVEDFKVGAVTLERAKGSSLVHAIGTLRNDSPHQRFGVKLELELTGPAGNKIGTAKDYRNILEPHQEWHFRALVLDSKAVAAKVSSIREDE